VAEAIRAGRLSSVEAIETCLDRIRCANPRLNAVVTVDTEGARQAARDADVSRARGGACGPLHGVPITIKDSFETVALLDAADAIMIAALGYCRPPCG
jgi:Asp-tRNA(Asn)/Glu-tRNA(Gln) amidotransferase A subunit family amidase